MKSDQELLEELVKDGRMNYSEWPGLLDRIGSRLEHIVHNEFPIPKLPTPGSHPPSSPPQHASEGADTLNTTSSSQDSQTTDKENAPPPAKRPRLPSNSHPNQRPTLDQSTSVQPPEGTLPPQLLSLLTSILHTLQTNFSKTPPHTVQRLAELLLQPRAHYRTLPSYLRALDRVVSVSSGADIFPLPHAVFPKNGDANSVLNGIAPPVTNTPMMTGAIGSDESLGGALLTPIPWLQNVSVTRDAADDEDLDTTETGGASDLLNTENAEGASTGAGNHIEDISNGISHSRRDHGGVTQGELLRQEQEAGVIPVSQTRNPIARARMASSATGESETAPVGEGGEDELPHARGPEEVGVEDMGPQERAPGAGAGFSVEAALGRSVPTSTTELTPTQTTTEQHSEGANKPEQQQTSTEAESQSAKDEENLSKSSAEKEKDGNDGNGDTVMVTDPDGKTEEGEQTTTSTTTRGDATGDNEGPDAVDTTMR